MVFLMVNFFPIFLMVFPWVVHPVLFHGLLDMSTNNVLLGKIEGPVWYTIYHHLPVVKGVVPHPSIYQQTNGKMTSMMSTPPVNSSRSRLETTVRPGGQGTSAELAVAVLGFARQQGGLEDALPAEWMA